MLNTPQESNLPLIIIRCRRFFEGVVDSEGAARLLHPHPFYSFFFFFVSPRLVRRSTFVRTSLLPVFLSRWQIMPLRGSIMTQRVEINESKHGKPGDARTRRSWSVSARTMPPSCATGPIVGQFVARRPFPLFRGERSSSSASPLAYITAGWIHICGRRSRRSGRSGCWCNKIRARSRTERSAGAGEHSRARERVACVVTFTFDINFPGVYRIGPPDSLHYFN